MTNGVNVKVEGIEETRRNMAALAKKFGREIAQAAYAGAQDVRTTAIKSIQTQSPGEQVTRTRVGGSTYEHVAAAEGEAPNTDTGALVNSVQVETTPKGVLVGSRLQYAGWLENGTRLMRPRPWLFPALEANRAKIEKAIGRAVSGVIVQSGRV